jgi:hypothetical protein
VPLQFSIAQLHINGIFVGGGGIVREMNLSGELGDLLRTSDASGGAPSKNDGE